MASTVLQYLCYQQAMKMDKRNMLMIAFLSLQLTLVLGCLITNCPRGGKRSGKFSLQDNSLIKQCITCGPAHTGQCFGPNICCGPFGCLLGTPETIVCKREGLFHESEPCIAGYMSCKKNSGRCAIEGICCNQESCQMDKMCIALEDKLERGSNNIVPLGFYGFGNYPNLSEYIAE